MLGSHHNESSPLRVTKPVQAALVFTRGPPFQSGTTPLRGYCSTRPDGYLAYGSELGHDLIHVVVLIRGQASNKMYVRSSISKGLVFRVKLTILFARHWIVRVALRLWELVNDARFDVFLPR